MTTAQDGGNVFSLMHRPLFTPRKYSWYSFLLEAESTPRSQCDRKDYVNEKFQWHHLESNQRPSDLQHSALTTEPPRSTEETIQCKIWYNMWRFSINQRDLDFVSKSRKTLHIIQGVPLVTEPSISLIILTPMKILQRNLNRNTFVVWEMERNVSVVCVCSVCL